MTSTSANSPILAKHAFFQGMPTSPVARLRESVGISEIHAGASECSWPGPLWRCRSQSAQAVRRTQSGGVADSCSRPICRLSDLDSGHHFFGCRRDPNCQVPPMLNDASALLGLTGRWPRVEGPRCYRGRRIEPYSAKQPSESR